MTEQEERNFDKFEEKYFKSHPELPNGRNFMCWNREKNTKGDRKYKKNFDAIFPNAPGAGI